MIKQLPLLILLALGQLTSVLPMKAQTPVPPDRNLLIGIWHYEDKGKRAMEGYTTFYNEGTGESIISTTQNGQTAWMFVQFEWEIDKFDLHQKVLKTNLKNISSGSASRDRIISIDDRHYVHKDGKRTISENRVEEIPLEFAERLMYFKSGKKPAHVADHSEEPTHLSPLEVRERPFGVWGLMWSVQTSVLNSISGGPLPPKDGYMVAGVVAGSPADRAGVQPGDELLNVNGTAAVRFPLKEFRKLFFESSSGDEILIGAYNRLTSVERPCTLKLDAGFAWHTPGKFVLNYWGAFVRGEEKLNPKFVVQISKVRYVTVTWGGSKCILIERPGSGVEMVINKIKPNLLPVGSELLLKDGGEYEIRNPAAPGDLPPLTK